MGYLFLVCTTLTSADSTFGCIGLTGDQGKVKEHIALLMDKEDAIFPCAWLSVSAVLSRIIEGAFDRAKFQDFITELDSVVPEHKVFVMDNCCIHYSVNSTTHELRYLPLYSPFLTPIESFFSQLNNGMRSRLRGANLEAMEQLQRKEFLKQAIQSELDQLHN